jgi:hypothetical protein
VVASREGIGTVVVGLDMHALATCSYNHPVLSAAVRRHVTETGVDADTGDQRTSRPGGQFSGAKPVVSRSWGTRVRGGGSSSAGGAVLIGVGHASRCTVVATTSNLLASA